jgi:hypothetical protein
VTVRDWIVGRASAVPSELTTQILALLGTDAEKGAERAAELCLSAATRSLDGLLAGGRYGRDSALYLLAIDALTTYAFEHACEAGKPESVRALAIDGARAVSQLSIARG